MLIDRDLIKREDALNCIKKLYAGHTACNMFEALDAVAEYIEELPSAERKGKWIYKNGAVVYPWWECYECSECGARSGMFKFCPNCGAKMEGEEE